jgi:hypothetical protein
MLVTSRALARWGHDEAAAPVVPVLPGSRYSTKGLCLRTRKKVRTRVDAGEENKGRGLEEGHRRVPVAEPILVAEGVAAAHGHEREAVRDEDEEELAPYGPELGLSKVVFDGERVGKPDRHPRSVSQLPSYQEPSESR